MNNFKLTRNKFLGNIIEFESDGSVRECMYDVSDKIADIIEDLQKKAEHQEQIIKSQYGTIKSVNKTSKNRKEAIKSLLVQNEKLKKKAELGDHYKHLYSELKKQKDDVVEYIKSLHIFSARSNGKTLFAKILNEILRMLGEIDE